MLIRVVLCQLPIGQEGLTLRQKLQIMKQGADFVCLPEYFLMPRESIDYSKFAVAYDRNVQYLAKLSRDLNTTIIGGSIVMKIDNDMYNTSFVFHKGYFPESTKSLQPQKYSLVSMDVDLYNPTKAGLEYFYPLLQKGGVLLIHDHKPDWPGIMKAVEEFSHTISEPFIQLIDKDSTVMLVKS